MFRVPRSTTLVHPVTVKVVQSYPGANKPLLTEISSFEVERPTPYVAEHLRAVRGALVESKALVEARLKDFRRIGTEVALPLRDGTEISGRVVHAEAESLRVRTSEGKEVATETSMIASPVFLQGTALASARRAFTAFSLDPVRALEDLLTPEDPGESILLLPFVVRLAGAEAVDGIERALAAGGAPPGKGSRGQDALAALDAFLRHSKRALEFYGYLAPEFERAEREAEALRLFLSGQWGRVLASGEGTRAFPFAAEALLAGFERAVAGEAGELMAGTAVIDFRWKLYPAEPDDEKLKRFLRRDPRENVVVLADPEGPRHFAIGGEGAPESARGLLVRYRFEPGEGGEWRLPLGERAYLRVTANEASLHRPSLSPGGSDDQVKKAALPAPKPDEKYRSLVLIPSSEEGSIHVFFDRVHLFAVTPKEGTLSRHLTFTVLRSSLFLRSAKVIKEENKENEK